MSAITEETHRGEFLVSEANGGRSREQVTIASGEDLKAGHVLGQVSSSGEYKEYDPSNADGSETAVAVLYGAVDATGGAEDGAIIARDAEVNENQLTFFSGATDAEQDTAKTELANQGIIAR